MPYKEKAEANCRTLIYISAALICMTIIIFILLVGRIDVENSMDTILFIFVVDLLLVFGFLLPEYKRYCELKGRQLKINTEALSLYRDKVEQSIVDIKNRIRKEEE